MEERVARPERGVQRQRCGDRVEPPVQLSEELRVCAQAPGVPREIVRHRAPGDPLDDQVRPGHLAHLGDRKARLSRVLHDRGLVLGRAPGAVAAKHPAVVDREDVRVAAARDEAQVAQSASSRAAFAMCAAEIPAASSSSAGLPEPGMSRTARCR